MSRVVNPLNQFCGESADCIYLTGKHSIDAGGDVYFNAAGGVINDVLANVRMLFNLIGYMPQMWERSKPGSRLPLRRVLHDWDFNTERSLKPFDCGGVFLSLRLILTK